MDAWVYLCRRCGEVLHETATPENDAMRAVGWCVVCGTWGWGDRKRLERPEVSGVEPADR